MPDYGPPLIDFSSLGRLGETFLNARDHADKRSRAQMLTDLGSNVSAGGPIDYNQAAGAAFQAGDSNLGFNLLKMGESNRGDSAAFELLNGAGSSQQKPATAQGSGGYLPSVVGTTAPRQKSSFDASSIPAFVGLAGQNAGLSPDYLPKVSWIESKGDPNAVSPTGASGLLQFTGGTAKQYGLVDPFDPKASAEAGARLSVANRDALTQRLGRAPTDAELYLAHQQGAGGAAALLSNPDALAVDALAPAYGGNRGRAAQAIVVNGGRPNMRAGDFAAMWTGKYDGLGGGSGVPGGGNAPIVASNEAEVQSAERATGMMPATVQGPAPTRTAQAGPAQVGGAPAADVPAPGAVETQFVVPGTGETVPAWAMTPRLQNILKAAQSAKSPEARQTVNAVLQAELSDIKSRVDEARKDARGPEAIQEWKWARQNGLTTSKNPAEYAKEKSTKDDIETQVSQRQTAATGQGLDPNSPEGRRYVLTGQMPSSRDASIDVAAQAREQQATRLGLDPNEASTKRFILTGQMPDPAQEGQMKAGEQKIYKEVYEKKNTLTHGIDSLQRALTLNDQIYSGDYEPGFKRAVARNVPGWMGGNLITDQDRVAATADYNNLVGSATLAQGKELFGARVTNYDEKLLQDLKANPNMTPKERAVILKEMIAHRERTLADVQQEEASIKSGTFFKRGAGGGPASSQATAAPASPNVTHVWSPDGGLQQVR